MQWNGPGYRSGSNDIPEIPTVVEEGALSGQQLTQLTELLDQPWSTEQTDACDGTAWEFKMYENGEVTKYRDLGYIYGIEPYESISKLLMEDSQ